MSSISSDYSLLRLQSLFQTDGNDFLSAFSSAQHLSTPFADSTHRIWALCGEQQQAVLKVADLESVSAQVFWQGMRDLFAWDLVGSYTHLTEIYRFFSSLDGVTVPILGGTCFSLQGKHAALLTEFIDGQALDIQSVDIGDCQNLARYLMVMHQQKHTKVGVLGGSKTLNLQQFRQRILSFLERSPRLKTLSSNELSSLIEAANHFQTSALVSMVLDLRWDQFMKRKNNELVLLDIDAAISAPVEMDWLMLEAVFPKTHLRALVCEYKQHMTLPNKAMLREVRELYRALFCGLGLLGEQEWAWWRDLPPHLDELID
ncbi:hypothetical protein J3998_09460 [Thiomicrorhabdus sp. 6S2-11]|uniref:Aminoglycoside phosphotransferase domain-containing protein n=1 Tax=Thiomicrorhabdus marina TaxID=2818442 RepID=A0ABS3Q6V6_9GAMM|nr:hypothetical protein [Thiomicrorhabdus marina]MBO1927803.1 hypothetical protein [Thiomicrorhabdus marina]